MVVQKPGIVQQVIEIVVSRVGTFFVLVNRETERSYFSGTSSH
jgi:hypothetical protein